MNSNNDAEAAGARNVEKRLEADGAMFEFATAALTSSPHSVSPVQVNAIVI